MLHTYGFKNYVTMAIYSTEHIYVDHTDEAPLPNINMECQRWTEKRLISERSGTQYVAMVTKIMSVVEHL